MHAEGNALRQRFVPQPMLRSSWPQLVIPVFFSSPLSFLCSFLLLCHSRVLFFSSVIPVFFFSSVIPVFFFLLCHSRVLFLLCHSRVLFLLCHSRVLFLLCHSRVLFSPLSFPCLARESKRDVRLKAEHDKKSPLLRGFFVCRKITFKKKPDNSLQHYGTQTCTQNY